LSLDLVVRNTFAPIQLIQAFLDGCKELNSRRDVIKRNLVGQLADGIQDKFFLRHVVEYARPVKSKQIGSGD
jgi:hypothetical protein